MNAGSSSSPPPVAIDHDLYCLYCGYNLRGLSGDPVRCPECGNLNPIGDVEIPADIIARQLKKMETEPAFALAAVLAFVICAGLLWFSRAEVPEATGGCLVAGLAWPILILRFRSSCLRKPGWLAAILAYHFWGLLMIVTTVGAVPCVLWASEALADLVPDSRMVSIGAPVAGLCLLGIGVWFWVPWAHHRAKAGMVQLQREVAVTLAREEIRKRMAGGMWHGPFG